MSELFTDRLEAMTDVSESVARANPELALAAHGRACSLCFGRGR